MRTQHEVDAVARAIRSPLLGAFTQNLRFPDHCADQGSGLNYNVNRDQDASIGRYVQSYLIGFARGGGDNTDAYVGGNSLSHMDPTGEFLVPAVTAVTAITAII